MHRTAAAALLLAATLPATTFERVSTAELARRARRVCAVQCESCRAARDPDSGVVFTHVRLRLLEDLKGRSAGSVIDLRIVGGEADGVKFVVAGMPRFRAGEESVLLLGAANRAGYPTLVAARRGMLRLQRDEEGRRFLRDPVDGFASLEGKRRVELAQFRAAIRAQAPGKDAAK
jgi:hypothetical protein